MDRSVSYDIKRKSLSHTASFFTDLIHPEFYEQLKSFAQYGETFRRVDQVFIGDREALVRIKGLDDSLAR